MDTKIRLSSFVLVGMTIFFFYTPILKGQDLSSEQEQALSGAVEELTDPAKRSENLKKDPKAAKSDEMVKEVGGEYSEEIYGLAGEVMQSLVKKTQGDPDKMEQLLKDAEKNPEAFANTFTPDQKKALKELSKKIEKSKQNKLP